MVMTKAVSAVTDWTAVAQNTVVESATLDCSSHYGTMLHIQAFLDNTTAHTGTRFIVQASSNTTGDEDWQDLTEFVALIGTAVTDLIENNPLAQNSTAITLTGHAYTDFAKWLAIEDGTLVDSELVFVKANADANTVDILDGTANAHAVNTAMFDVAVSKVVMIPPETYRVRLVVANNYDADGATLNYKLRASEITAI